MDIPRSWTLSDYFHFLSFQNLPKFTVEFWFFGLWFTIYPDLPVFLAYLISMVLQITLAIDIGFNGKRFTRVVNLAQWIYWIHHVQWIWSMDAHWTWRPSVICPMVFNGFNASIEYIFNVQCTFPMDSMDVQWTQWIHWTQWIYWTKTPNWCSLAKIWLVIVSIGSTQMDPLDIHWIHWTSELDPMDPLDPLNTNVKL